MGGRNDEAREEARSFPLSPMGPTFFERPQAPGLSERRHAGSLASPAPTTTGTGVPLPENRDLLAQLDRDAQVFLETAVTALGRSPVTCAWYLQSYQNFRRFLVEGLDLPAPEFTLRVRAIDAWVRWNRTRGVGAMTVNSYYRGLRAVFKDLVARTGLDDPFRGLVAPPVPQRLPKALSAADCKKVLEAAWHFPWPNAFERTRNSALLATMLYAGLRKGEVLRLRFAEVDLAGGTIRIVRGKGRYGGTDRTAYMAPELADILREYLRERTRRQLVNPEFFGTLKGRALSDTTLRRMVAAVRRASGVAFSPHVLRHSFVTHLIRSGTPLPVVKELAGHRDIATTMGYVKVFDEDRRDGIRRFRLF